MGEVSNKTPVSFKKLLGEDYDDGQTVHCIEGTISALFPVKKGTGASGEWEFQGAKMKDSEGTEIDISFAKNTQPATAKGKFVTIRSVKSEAHGWNGIKVEDQSYTPQGKSESVTKRVIKVTATADIVYKGEQPGSQSQGGQAQGGGSQPASQGGGSSSQWKGGSAPFMPWDIHPERGLEDIMHLHSRCTDIARSIYPVNPENPLNTADFIHAAAATMFIEACKQGIQVNYVERASKPIPPKITAPPADPKDWKTCMIPKGEMMGKTLNDLSEDQLTAFYDAMKEKETPLAKCVQFGFEERGYLQKRRDAEAKANSENSALAPDDDIPF